MVTMAAECLGHVSVVTPEIPVLTEGQSISVHPTDGSDSHYV